MAAKRTRKLLVLALCLHTSLVFSQTTFQKTYGGLGNESATWVTEAMNGFVVAGHVTSPSGNQDGLLIRLNASGNMVWQNRFGAGQADAFHCVVGIPDGGFFAVGETRSFGAGNADMFLVKVDAAGSMVWSKTIGDAGRDEIAKSVMPVAGGGFVVSGYSALNTQSASSSVLLRLDAAGNTIWSRTYTTEVSNLFLSNYIDGNIIYASGGADNDGIFARLDLATGNILSTKTYAGTGAEALYCQQPTLDGNLVIADNTWSTPIGTDVELWAQKINKTTGQVIWSKIYYRPYDNIRGRIEKVNDGGFLLVPYDHNNTAQADALLAKIDANGNLLWSYNYGGAAADRLFKAIQTSDGGFVAVGDTRSGSANGNSDILVVKINANGRIQGICPKNADILSADFTTNNSSITPASTNWIQTSTFNTTPLSVNLLGLGFTANAAPVIQQNISLCPNVSFKYKGVDYYAPKIINDTLKSVNGCDTITRFNLVLSPFNLALHVFGLCSGETYAINGIHYVAPVTVIDTIPSLTGGCDTICSYVLKSKVQSTTTQTVNFCSGESVMIGGQLYSHADTVLVSIPTNVGECDNLLTYILVEHAQPVRNTTLSFCPGESVLIEGVTYDHPGTVVATIPAMNGGCDTLVTYTLVLRNPPTRTEALGFCQGESVTVLGQSYTQSTSVVVNIPASNGGCDTMVTYTITMYPLPTRAETHGICPGESVTIAGQTYGQPTTIIANLASTTGGCDTVVTYTLALSQQLARTEHLGICPGESVTIADQTYDQPTTVIANLASNTNGCDTVVTYILAFSQQVVRAETIQICPGESVTITGQTYNQPGIVIANYPAASIGCDTIVTYTILLNSQITRAETRGFCPGESVTIAGQSYTQPGTVTVNLASSTGGCDTVVTYTLQHLTPAPSNIAIQCPNDITIIATNLRTTSATYEDPIAASDCICPGLQWNRTAGPASGSFFPVGTTQVCYSVKDNCGQEKPCCFSVNIREEDPCDVKENGCMKYELLSITADQNKNHTYRIRVTNNCPSKLAYTAIQIPDGMMAMEPSNNAAYISSDGRSYIVRSPNFSPMYSIRFKSTADSISDGQSDVFEYTLPAQTTVTYINVSSRLSNKVSNEVLLNTFNCPVGITPINSMGKGTERGAETITSQNALLLFPNPTTGIFYADLSDWQGQKLQLQVMNTQGQLIQALKLVADEDLLRIEMQQSVTNGIYFLEVAAENGRKEVLRFMLQR